MSNPITFGTVLNQIATCLLVCMPLACLAIFMGKLSKLSCIEVTDKCYILLGCIAIISYWVWKWAEWGEKK